MTVTADNALADLQRANVELQRQLGEYRAERDEALEQQTATAEILGVINASPGDLAPVFDAILDKALRLCGGSFGSMTLAEPDWVRTVATCGVPAAFAKYREHNPAPVNHPGIAGRLRGGDPYVHILDLKDTDLYRNNDPQRRAVVELGGARTGIAVALRKNNDFLGGILIYRKEVRPFSARQLALLQNFAAQAVIAIENARLITETREALEQQTATAEVLGVINSCPGDLAPVFEAILDKAHILCAASKGSLVIIDGDKFRTVAMRGLSEPYAEILRAAQHNPAGSVPDRLLKGENLVHLTDARESEFPVPRAAAELEGARTILYVPLKKDGSLLGYLTAYRQEVRPFSHKQIALLRNFAAQAIIAMENARLITATREALAQQTATAEVLGVINSSPGELTPVFEAMLEKATRVCDATFGMMSLYDGEGFQRVAEHNVPAAYAEFIKNDPPQPSPHSALGRIRDGERVVNIADVARDQAVHPSDPRRRALMDLGGARSYVAVGLFKENKLLGTLAAYRQELRPFSEQQIALLENFAAQAVIAMENARLLTETREALEQQTATAEVLQVINSSPGDLAPVFDAILEKAHSLCGAAHGALVIYDDGQFRAAAIQGMPQEFGDLLRQPFRAPAGGAQERLLHGERLIRISDVAIAEPGTPIQKASIEAGVRTLLMVPLRKDEALLGYIAAWRREVRPFADRQIALLQDFAAQAVIAMENARLISETREALDQQTATAEVLQVINSSPGDLGPVFDAILEKAHALCGAAHGGLLIRDGEGFRIAAVHGEEAFTIAWRQMGPLRPAAGSPLDRMLRGERMVQVANALEDEFLYRNAPPALRRLQEIGNIRTLLIVPLTGDDGPLGAITAFRQEVRPFTEKQIALLQNFAAQAVIAMENARLLGELRQRNDEIAGWNMELEDRVAAQLDELERVGKLKRFLAPQLAELIVARGDEAVLETHRRDIVVVFCDLRDFTAFAETAEPEEVLDLLREYHGVLGPIVSASEGTLDHFSGDGIMVFFNDPVPVADASERAVRMAIAMRTAMAGLQQQWRRLGRRIGFGGGIARGYATLGQIGFADRIDYTAIGTVCNLAARLCAEAKDGQILVSQRVAVAVEDAMPLEAIGEVALKGLSQPVAVYNVPVAGAQAALRVIEGGAPTA